MTWDDPGVWPERGTDMLSDLTEYGYTLHIPEYNALAVNSK